MKFKYTDILIVSNLVNDSIDVVEAPAHTVHHGDIVTYGTSFFGHVLSRHWCGNDTDADSSYAMAKTLADPIYTCTGYARLHEVVPDNPAPAVEVEPDEDT